MTAATASNEITCDVAIIGGGPGGSTTGSLLRKYNPKLKVCVFEKEKFPREHIDHPRRLCSANPGRI